MKHLYSSDIMTDLLPSVRTGKISVVTEGSTTVVNTRLHMTFAEASRTAHTTLGNITRAHHPPSDGGRNGMRDILNASRVGIVIATSQKAHNFLRTNPHLISRQRLIAVDYTRYKNNPQQYNENAPTVGRLFTLQLARWYQGGTGVADDYYLLRGYNEDSSGFHESFGRAVMQAYAAGTPIVDLFSVTVDEAGFDGDSYLYDLRGTVRKFVDTITYAETGERVIGITPISDEQILEVIDEVVSMTNRARNYEYRMFVRDSYDRSVNLALPVSEKYKERFPEPSAGSILNKTLSIRQSQQRIIVDLAVDPETHSGMFGPEDHEYYSRGVDRTASDLADFYVDVSFRLPSDNMEYFYMSTYSFFNPEQVSNIGIDITPINSDRSHLRESISKAFKNGSKDLIISDGRVGPTSYLLYDANNVLYTGPYHKIGKVYRKGLHYRPITTPKGGILTLKSVPNTKIQDFRLNSRFYPNPYDITKINSFVDSHSYITHIVKKNMKNKLKMLRDKRVKNKITNMTMTNTVFRGNRVVGSIKIDQAEILSKNSLFGELFDMSKPSDKLQFLWWGDMFSLLDIKIMRKRVKELKVGKSNNSIYVDFDPNEPVEVLISGKEKYPGSNLFETVTPNRAKSLLRDSAIRTESRFQHAHEYSDAVGRFYEDAPGLNEERDLKARLADRNFIANVYLTADQMGERMNLLFRGDGPGGEPMEYPADPDNPSKILFPWVREMTFEDFSFHANSGKTGLYQYGVEVTFTDGVANKIYELYQQLVIGRSAIERYKMLVFGTTGHRSAALVNYDIKNDRVSDTIKTQISNSLRESLYEAVEAYEFAYTVIYCLVIGGDPETEAVMERISKDSRYSVILDGLTDDAASGLADDVFTRTRSDEFLSKSASSEAIESFTRAYDLMLKTIEDFTSFSKMDASSSLSEKASPSGKSIFNFTMSGWFKPEIGKGIVDMRNQDLLRASVLPPSVERSEDMSPVYDPEVIQGRLNNEFYKFGLIGRDPEGNRLSAAATVKKLNEQGFSAALLSAPATLTIQSVVGSSVWADGFDGAIKTLNSDLWGLLDLITNSAQYDRSNVENLQTKNKNELLNLHQQVLEEANNAEPSGMSVHMSPAAEYSVVSTAMEAARSQSIVKVSHNSVVPKPKKKKIKISFEAGEQCNAYSQSTRRALIDHQRQHEHIERKLIRQALEKQLKQQVQKATPLQPSVVLGTSNESDGMTAEPMTLETARKSSNNASSAASPLTPIEASAPLAYSIKTIKDYKEKTSKAHADQAHAPLPLQLVAVESGASNYGKVDDDKMSSSLFGNIMTINKVVGYDKNETGTPNLKTEKLEPVSVAQVMSGLTPGKYAMVPYVNVSAGIPATSQLPMIDSFFTIVPSTTSANKKPKDSSSVSSVVASSTGGLSTALRTANMMSTGNSTSKSTSKNTTKSKSGGSTY